MYVALTRYPAAPNDIYKLVTITMVKIKNLLKKKKADLIFRLELGETIR